METAMQTSDLCDTTVCEESSKFILSLPHAPKNRYLQSKINESLEGELMAENSTERADQNSLEHMVSTDAFESSDPFDARSRQASLSANNIFGIGPKIMNVSLGGIHYVITLLDETASVNEDNQHCRSANESDQNGSSSLMTTDVCQDNIRQTVDKNTVESAPGQKTYPKNQMGYSKGVHLDKGIRNVRHIVKLILMLSVLQTDILQIQRVRVPIVDRNEILHKDTIGFNRTIICNIVVTTFHSIMSLFGRTILPTRFNMVVRTTFHSTINLLGCTILPIRCNMVVVRTTFHSIISLPNNAVISTRTSTMTETYFHLRTILTVRSYEVVGVDA